jgi:hypothetical protein
MVSWSVRTSANLVNKGPAQSLALEAGNRVRVLNLVIWLVVGGQTLKNAKRIYRDLPCNVSRLSALDVHR